MGGVRLGRKGARLLPDRERAAAPADRGTGDAEGDPGIRALREPGFRARSRLEAALAATKP